MKKLLLAALLVVPVAAVAQETPKHRFVPATLSAGSQDLMGSSGCALNGSCAFSLKLGQTAGFSILVLYHFFDYSSNAGAITTTCTATKNASAYVPTTCDVASGTCTLAFGGVWTTPSLSADKRYYFPLGVLGVQDLTCTVTHGGTPGASEKIYVVGDLVTQ